MRDAKTGPERVVKAEAEWLREPTPEQFRVTRLKATERPFSGRYDACKVPGTYHCVCCGQALFGSAAKFDSGSGWPSFSAAIAGDAAATEADDSLGIAGSTEPAHMLWMQCSNVVMQ